jgi:hypothetical protein
MIIYKTINTLNQRYYIGKDAANNLNYYGSGRAIKAAIKKYGKKNFTKQTIEVVGGTDLGKLLEREIYWIDKYDAINDKKSYNIQRDSGLRPKVTTKEETRKKISAAVRMAYETNEEYRKKITEHNQGETNPMFGRTQSEYQRKRVKDANTGKVYSEETRKKISEARMGTSFLTEEGKKNIGEATKERWAKYREQKIKKYGIKVPLTKEEIKKKQSDAAKKRWEKYRNEKQKIQSNLQQN